MIKLKKVLALIIIFLLIASVFAGCFSKRTSITDGTEDSSQSGTSGYLITKEPLELTIHLHYWNTIVFDDEWPVFKKAAELTNISLKGTVSKAATESKQIFNVMIASNELPDIIHSTRNNINRYGMEGAFIPLNDLIDKHAPNIKKYFEENPEFKKHVTAPDGNIYSITFIPDGEVASGYFIRKDWLDKLGLEIPKTVDEYYNVLKAFKNEDPNGNGKKDEIPFFARNADESIRFVNLFGVRTTWYVDENGKVHYGQYDPEFKDAIVNLAKWYSEGLIDQEIFTRGSKAREELLGNNTGGSTHDWIGSTASYNEKYQESVPGLNFIPIAPPADIHGKVWEETSRPAFGSNAWGISYKNKHPVETIKYFDFWFSEAGRRLMNFGIEGVHYTMEDGKPKFKDEVLSGQNTVLDILNRAGAQIEIGFHQDFAYEEQWLIPIAKEGMRLYTENKYLVEQFPDLPFTEEEQKIIDAKWPSIETFIDETLQKWLLGVESPEVGFDKYISRLKEMGMDEIIQVRQQAYDRYNSMN